MLEIESPTSVVTSRDDRDLAEILFEDAADSSRPLSPDCLVLNLFHKGDHQTRVVFEIISSSAQDAHLVQIFELESAWTELDRIVLGCNDETRVATSPSFLVLLHALQIFQGGYFLGLGQDDSDLRAFSKSETEVAFAGTIAE